TSCACYAQESRQKTNGLSRPKSRWLWALVGSDVASVFCIVARYPPNYPCLEPRRGRCAIFAIGYPPYIPASKDAQPLTEIRYRPSRDDRSKPQARIPPTSDPAAT